MITKPLLLLKRQVLLASILYTITLLIFSLITIDLGGIESFAPSFGDKIFHFCAYALLAYTWYFTLSYKFNIQRIKAIIIVSFGATLFGIIIEVLQKAFTSTRYFDIEDIIANVLGVLLTLLILLLNTKRDVK